MASQVQLFDAISQLPECRSFPNWSSLEIFYNTQKEHVQGVPTESGNAVFSLKFSTPMDPPERKGSPENTAPPEPSVSQTTSVILPSVLQRQFPLSKDTPLALLPCPHCLRSITVSMNYVGKVENPLDQFLAPLETTEDETKLVVAPKLSSDMSSAPILAEIERQMMVRPETKTQDPQSCVDPLVRHGPPNRTHIGLN